MITFLCAAVCQGCRAPVNVWKHGDQVVIRDRSMVESPVHLCPPELRERIDMDYYDARAAKRPYPWPGSMEMIGATCPDCGSQDVALSTWGRLVDFPCADIDMEGWAEAWVGPLQKHVCATGRNNPAQQRVSGVEVPTL